MLPGQVNLHNVLFHWPPSFFHLFLKIFRIFSLLPFHFSLLFVYLFVLVSKKMESVKKNFLDLISYTTLHPISHAFRLFATSRYHTLHYRNPLPSLQIKKKRNSEGKFVFKNFQFSPETSCDFIIYFYHYLFY